MSDVVKYAGTVAVSRQMLKDAQTNVEQRFAVAIEDAFWVAMNGPRLGPPSPPVYGPPLPERCCECGQEGPGYGWTA